LKQFPSYEIKLIITGKEIARLTEQQERTRYNYSSNTTETYYETVVHKGENSFFGYTFPLYNYNNFFAPG